VLLWWLKPAFDRVLLHGYSRALFGETTSTRDSLRAIPSLLRGRLLSDTVAILSSLNIIAGELDR